MAFKKSNFILALVVLFVLGGAGLALQGKDGVENSINAVGQKSEEVNSSQKSKAQPAPDFTLKLNDGTEQKLSDLKGKIVVLNFWSVDCPPCLSEIKNIEAVYKKGDSDVVIIGIATDKVSVEETQNVLSENGGSYPIMVDANNVTFNTYGIRATPTTVVVNGEGEIAGGHTGFASEEQLLVLIGKARS